MLQWLFKVKEYFFPCNEKQEGNSIRACSSAVTCSLCGESRSFEFSCKTNSWLDLLREESIAQEALGYRELWLTNEKPACPNCISKLRKGIVPGMGVKLVLPDMFAAGKAFEIKDFAKSETEERSDSV